MKSHDQVIQELNEAIPRDDVQKREAANGAKLDYLAGWYVIDRLNQVLGQGYWSYDSTATLLHQGTVQQRNGEAHSVHYSARVLLVAKFPNGEQAQFVDYGYGDGTDRSSPGKAHELAIKEAVTDGLKRCAKNLGMSMGLALYDKTQEFVDDAPRQVEAPKKSSPAAVHKKILALGEVLIAKKTVTLPELRAMIKEYGVDTSDQLSEDQANDVMSKMEALLNGTK